MASTIRPLFFQVSKLLGLFLLASWITRRELRILCYHGISIFDEHKFRPMLFMQPSVFAQRMRWLKQRDIPVLSLDDAITQLDSGLMPRLATVITIDDGWYGTYSVMAPALKEQGFPSTLYLSTYYTQKQTQVFGVAVAYLLWARPNVELDLSEVDDSLKGRFDLGDSDARERACELLFEWAAAAPSAEARQSLLRRVCSLLDIDANELESARAFTFVNEDEARDLANYDMGLELHTHRHRFGGQPIDIQREEIETNRRLIERLQGGPADHFCFPSGDTTDVSYEQLAELGVKTATTTENGLNDKSAPRLSLRRILDSDDLTLIELEAEITGFKEVLRRIVRGLKRS